MKKNTEESMERKVSENRLYMSVYYDLLGILQTMQGKDRTPIDYSRAVDYKGKVQAVISAVNGLAYARRKREEKLIRDNRKLHRQVEKLKQMELPFN